MGFWDFFKRKKGDQAVLTEKLINIVIALDQKHDKLEDMFKKLKGFTYKKVGVPNRIEENEYTEDPRARQFLESTIEWVQMQKGQKDYKDPDLE